MIATERLAMTYCRISAKNQGIDFSGDAEEDVEDDTDGNDDQPAKTIIDEDSDMDSSDPGTDAVGRFQSVRRRKLQKRHSGLLTFLAAMFGLAGSHSRTELKISGRRSCPCQVPGTGRNDHRYQRRIVHGIPE